MTPNQDPNLTTPAQLAIMLCVIVSTAWGAALIVNGLGQHWPLSQWLIGAAPIGLLGIVAMITAALQIRG